MFYAFLQVIIAEMQKKRYAILRGVIMEIKDIIRKKRLECGYTMKELADKVGVSEATVSRWESGHLSTMKHTKIALLAEALGISPILLFTPYTTTTATTRPMFTLENTKNLKSWAT